MLSLTNRCSLIQNQSSSSTASNCLNVSRLNMMKRLRVRDVHDLESNRDLRHLSKTTPGDQDHNARRICNAMARAGKHHLLTSAKAISKSLSERVVIRKGRSVQSAATRNSLRCQVDGQLWDLERPLEKSCSLELLDFEHKEGIPTCCSYPSL